VWSCLWRIDFLEPLFSPKVKARAVTTAKVCSALAHHPIKQNDTPAFFDSQVALVDKPVHAFQDELGRAAVLCHLGHKAAATQLSPVIERGFDLFSAPHLHSIAGLQPVGLGNPGQRNWLGGSTYEFTKVVD
jgi:hypothetical protein